VSDSNTTYQYFEYFWHMKVGQAIIILVVTGVLLNAVACGTAVPVTITDEESALINGSPDVMRILTVDNEADLSVLRKASVNFTIADINTAEYATLVNKMVKTLENEEGGVGLAAPQIGICRRVVAVMRVDKEGEPIELYPNIRIEAMRGEMIPGHEGCLSVPDIYGDVMRYRDITIVYTDINSDRMDQPGEIREDVSGFAAVIFQHEVDHLDGIIFTDRMQ